MGSFIDGLPMGMNIKSLSRATKLISNPSAILDNENIIKNNLVLKNKDLVMKISSSEMINATSNSFRSALMKKPKYLSYNGDIYANRNEGSDYVKIKEGNFESDENFTRYNLSNSKNKRFSHSCSDVDNE